MKLLKRLIYTRLFIVLVYYFARFYCLTFRFRVVGEKPWMDLLKQGYPVLLCGWHQQFFGVIRYFKTYARFNPGLMISQSKDGELIAGVANRSGWHTVRGSSSRGGKAALDAMIAHLNHYGFGAHILDGPRGPMGKVKAGAIKMAHGANARLVPFYVHAPSAWYFNSWDRFMLPKPFSTVTLRFDRILSFPPTTVPEAFEDQRRDLEQTMAPALHWPGE